jgi:hypothetical protein
MEYINSVHKGSTKSKLLIMKFARQHAQSLGARQGHGHGQGQNPKNQSGSGSDKRRFDDTNMNMPSTSTATGAGSSGSKRFRFVQNKKAGLGLLCAWIRGGNKKSKIGTTYFYLEWLSTEISGGALHLSLLLEGEMSLFSADGETLRSSHL